MKSDERKKLMLGYIKESNIEIDTLYTVFHMYLPENHMSGKEQYSFWELVYVIDGELNTTADNVSYKLEKNSLILYAPGEFHTLYVDNGKSAEIFILTFSLRGSAVDKLKIAPYLLSDALSDDIKRIIDFCTQNSVASLKDYYIAHHTTFVEKPLFLSKVCALTEFLLLSLVEAQTDNSSLVNTLDTQMFADVTRCMQEQRTRFLSIEELAKIHNIGQTKMKALIKKYTGMSLHKYYLNLKLTQAVELFRQGCNITETSVELGFCNSNYFCTVFKRETGQTPSQYISKFKNN